MQDLEQFAPHEARKHVGAASGEHHLKHMVEDNLSTLLRNTAWTEPTLVGLSICRMI